MNIPVTNFPKLLCPFVREGKPHLVTPRMTEWMEWVFVDGVKAVDKVDGTNICVHILNGEIVAVDNRTNRKESLLKVTNGGWEAMCLDGIADAVNRGWLKDPASLLLPMQILRGERGPSTDLVSVYGELIGPRVNGNRHGLSRHMFVPFRYLLETCHWKSWSGNNHPKTFESIREWFRDLPSLFNQRMKLPDVQAEGLVFHHPDGRMAKLRRDMFDWFYDTEATP